jgi:aspartate kinase
MIHLRGPGSDRFHSSEKSIEWGTLVTVAQAVDRLVSRRVAFEKERGVTEVTTNGAYAHLTVSLRPHSPRPPQELAIYALLAEHDVSINLLKLHDDALSFILDEALAARAARALEEAGYPVQVTPSVTLVGVAAGNMRYLHGVMARIAETLLRERVPMVQTADAPDRVYLLVETALAERAAAALRAEFGIPEAPLRIVVQKFGGKSVGTAEARELAAERVKAARSAGLRPVVVVSAIGRGGEPYATDTLLANLHGVDPATEPAPRERDLIMACGEIISTVIMAQTLKAKGMKSIALTGAQAGILTDYAYGDAQIVDIDPTYILKLLYEQQFDAVVVAGFQGMTEPAPGARAGAITTLGRGGSDTTASALGVALRAEKVEIYTHVNGVMTADPDVVPGARTLPIVTYEEVCNMAHQGAKVLHPRAAEIAMMHQIPLWVKSSFVDAPGTRVAPISELVPPSKRGVTGITQLSGLAYVTLPVPAAAERAALEARVYRALGEARISCYLVSLGPTSTHFVVDQSALPAVRELLSGLGLAFETAEGCAMVSAITLDQWETPGLIERIAAALYRTDVRVLQIADSPASVSCLVVGGDAKRAVVALHEAFELAK